MNKTYYLYLSRLLHTNVIESQVINWIEILQRENIVFDLLIDNPVSDFFRKGNIKKTKDTILNFEKRLNGKIHYTFAVRRPWFLDFISSFIKAIFIIYLIKKKTKQNDFKKVIIQTRYMSDDISLKIVKYFSKNVFVIFDLRGDVPVEYLNKMEYDNIQDVKENNIKKEYYRLHNNQLRMCQLADKIFCVSDVFKNKLISDFDVISAKKVEVIPGGADSELFFYDSKIREEIRNQLKLDGKIVLIYTGRLLQH